MIEVLKKLSWFFKKEKKSYIAMAILLVLLSLWSVLPPLLIGESIDEIIDVATDFHHLLLLIGALIFVAITAYLYDRTYTILVNKKGQQLIYELREKYFDKLFQLDSKLFEKYSKGDLVSRVTQDLDYMRFAATTLLQELVYSITYLIFVFSVMIFSISPLLTVSSALIIPIGLLFILNRLGKKRKYYQKHRKIYSQMTESLLESVEGAKVIKAYTQEDNAIENMQHHIKEDIKSWRYIARFEAFYSPFMGFLVAFAYFLAFLVGSYLVITGQLTPGKLVTFSMYIGMINGPIISLSNNLQQINQAVTAKDRLYEILDLEPEVRDEKSDQIIAFDNLKFQDVYFKYPFDEYPVIKGLSFEISKGQTIGIVGPTGAGKSTIIRQLLREFNIQQGTVLLNNAPIRTYKLDDVRDLIGYVPQSHILFRGNIFQNLEVGKAEITELEIQKAVKIADFEKDIEFLSDGLNTDVGEFGAGLSGGQKQRLSIARAVIKEPEILILDDSLSAVDAKTERNIISHLQKERAEKTNIIIAHRFSAVREADNILVIQDGKISEQGTHLELMNLHGWYYKQYTYQTNSLKSEEEIDV